MLTGGMMASEYSSAPILFYPPPPSTEYLPATGARVTSYSPSPEPQPFSRPPPLNQQRNRKRSRDQTEDDEREAVFFELNTMDTAMPEPEPEPIYGEGMVLINPRTGQPVGSDPSSGTGTWCEEQAEVERLASAAAAEQQRRDEDEMAKAINRPIKAQRLDLSRIHGSLGGSPTTAPGILEPAPLTPTTPASPLIDEAAMMLGVGWRKVEGSGDVALAGASKGWAKFVNNHFANLSNCEILAKSEGKEAFFIKALDTNIGAEGFFLFDECLEHGQLLGCDIRAAVGNLQAGLFAGQLLTARRSATPEPVQLPTPAVEVAMEM